MSQKQSITLRTALNIHSGTPTDRETEMKQSISLRTALNILVADLPLSTRSLNVLAATGITTLQQLASQTSNDLLRSPNLGRKSLAEIEAILAGYDLSLGTHFPEPEQTSSSQTQQRRTASITAAARISTCQQNAYRWYCELEEQGCPSASNLLGYMHFWGKGTSQSNNMAIKHFKLAADMGHPLATRNLKLCCKQTVRQQHSTDKSTHNGVAQ